MKYSKTRYIKILENMIISYKKVYKDRPIPDKSLVILNKMESRLNEVRILPDNAILRASTFNYKVLDYSFNVSYN